MKRYLLRHSSEKISNSVLKFKYKLAREDCNKENSFMNTCGFLNNFVFPYFQLIIEIYNSKDSK